MAKYLDCRCCNSSELTKVDTVCRCGLVSKSRSRQAYPHNISMSKVSDVKLDLTSLNLECCPHIPYHQKELILAFSSSQLVNKDAFDDVISGKGKGIIMLLSGGPGIGKTLTAESVAENMKVPLYMMSAEDLGTQSNHVEESLTKILEMVAKWNAVLLLDECDVFLEERSAHDLERNKIVSIFLLTLEYYEGILFLTTNRVKNMDPAFQSRIHIPMEYPGLDTAARKKVWINFLTSILHEISAVEIDKLAQVDINGRQIKIVLKTGGLLARYKGLKLAYAYLKTVLDAEKRC